MKRLTSKYKNFSEWCASIHQWSHDLRIWRRNNNQVCASHLLECFSGVFLAAIDIVCSSKLHSKVFFRGAARQCDSAVSHFARVLHSQMPKTAEALNRYCA